MLLIEGFLAQSKLDELNGVLAPIPFVPGQSTGGVAGSLIKTNLQADGRHLNYIQANALVAQALLTDPAVGAYALANKITPIGFARYGAGMTYGDHVDSAVHALPNMVVRTDISFTIFLSGPEEYEGGELVVNAMGAERVVKGKAGDLFLYPTGVTHRVNAVRSGCRNVAIGWFQSLVPNHEHREILHKLITARAGLFKASGRTPEFENVNSVYENLLRLFAQP